MKNRSLIFAALAAMAGSVGPAGVATLQPIAQSPSAVSGQAGSPNSHVSFLQQMAGIGSGGGMGYGNNGPRYRDNRGFSVAEGKRRARKTRNRLRARGQHRRAVR